MPGSARDEAERLVATVLAMASTPGSRDGAPAGLGALSELVSRVAGAAINAAGEVAGEFTSAAGESRNAAGDGAAEPGEAGQGAAENGEAGRSSAPNGAAGHGSSWATGSAECCVCPICKAIAAMRDPGPETAVRLAAGAGDLATGVASMMRAVSAVTGTRRARPPAKPKASAQPDNADMTWSSATRNHPDHAWSAATNGTPGKADAQSGGAKAPASSGGADAWAEATAASAADAAHAEAERRAKAEALRAERRAAAKAATAAAAEAARRVEEAAAQARAARAAAQASGHPGDSAGGDSAGGFGAARGQDGGSGDSGRTPRRFDVWAAATADAGVGDVEPPPTVDHDGPGAVASEGRDGVAGDDARDGDAV